MKIAHLQLKDSLNNKMTLICHLSISGFLRYTLFGSWNSSGILFALSNLGCELPMEKQHDDQTKAEFVKHLVATINSETNYDVAKEVQPISFA